MYVFTKGCALSRATFLATSLVDIAGSNRNFRFKRMIITLLKSQTFGLAQTIWADKFWDIWGIFGRFISTQVQ